MKSAEGAPARIDPAQLESLYPDRAYRMMADGEATYACSREGSHTVCVPRKFAPSGVGFEYIGKPLAKLVAPADGETLTLDLTFRILEKGPCKYQIAPSTKTSR